ncbi:hypothetical protein BD779DRAFT_1675328 [Infundibulicybe gibba]|nr:hypothetical protein BD779DRAFT_1675328 [Infundibulicybe gibba]
MVSNQTFHLARERSFDIIITLRLDCPLWGISLSWDGEAPYTTYHPTVDILVESSDRWENISIFLPARIYNRSPLKSVRGNIPHLTHLSVGVLSDGSVADLPVHTWDMFEIAPKLVSFQCLNCCPTLFLVPWSQFTSIPSLSLGMDESIEILRNSPVLEEVTLLCGDGTPVFHPPVRHDHLKRLTIRSCVLDESDFDGFFKQVALDSLETLEIQVEYGSISSTFALFLSNISTLCHLSLDGYTFEDSHMIEALENTPFLSSFTVRRRLLRNYDEIFTRLGTKHREGGFDLVPKLETLNVTTFNWDLRSFIRLVELRAATLRDVRINVDQPPDARLYAQLKSMESETLSITVTTPIRE